MASIKFSGLVSGLKGSIGGVTFQGSSTGNMVKTKPYKVNPAIITPSGIQPHFNAKQMIAAVSRKWRTLTSEQRNSWALGASDYPAYNKFGEAYTPSAFQVFMTLNIKTFNYIGTFISTCPTPAEIPPVPSTVIDGSIGGEMQLTLGELPPENYLLLMWATKIFQPGKVPQKSDYKLIGQISHGDTNPLDITYNWEEVFGSFTGHGTIYFKFQLFNYVTGQTSPATYTSWSF